MGEPENKHELVEQLRADFPEEKDITLERFLIARQWNVEVAKKLLSDFLAWRETLGVVRLEELLPELRMGAFYFHGVTKKGNPIVVLKGSRITPGTITADGLIKLNVYVMERLMHFRPEVCKYALLFDFAGFGLSNMSYEILQKLIKVYNEYFPEVVEVEFFVNTPWLFSGIWSWVKGYLDERTRGKIHLLGNGWQKTLQEYIDPSQLQVEYGGTSPYKQEGWENADAENPCLGEIGPRPTDEATDDAAATSSTAGSEAEAPGSEAESKKKKKKKK